MIELITKGERLAAEAGDLDAFSGFNLRHVKQQVAELMRHIGENGLFDQYTRHDIAHVDAMLTMLDWIIPESTQECMTTADWLLIVLSIYFHDLGMLVTKAEYDCKNDSGYPTFRDSQLTSQDNEGKDYTERISRLSDEDREKFLYQEFVRAHHASRIRHWIETPTKATLGSTGTLTKEIQVLLANLDAVFRSDLAKVCESHHATDLDDIDKYLIRQPYGNTAAEIANVQYAAIVLRTADLLQITRDRTPSISFKVLTPSDPLSQYEWAKQMSVRAILPKMVRDRDGRVNENRQSSTVEVHAQFTEEEGFFALTTYLAYASRELNQSYEWASESNRKHGSSYTFPWRDIDTSHIKTVGFLPSHYEFKLDQGKILDLLTGHTLYNDTNVVIRELAQNAIDAVRLAFNTRANPTAAADHGRVTIRWDQNTRTLEFLDNGTGMTQEIIENNFLRVGASRYQEPRFRERFPDFNPISRFGIGVLSAFMIADSVEVFTCHPDEAEVRQISLRSVHGRYLIRLLDKDTDKIAKSLVPHGTLVRLRVRASADIGNVMNVARRWFVLPQCNLEAKIDDQESVKIGHQTLEDALQEILTSYGIVTDDSLTDRTVQIRSATRGSASLAYAVVWSKWFRTWELLTTNQARYLAPDTGPSSSERHEAMRPNLGICVEGVRVEFDSPGYVGWNVLAIANASGHSAPRTNVARSGLEETPELQALIQDIYQIYCSHISREIEELHESRGRSATGASSEAGFLLYSLQSGSTRSNDEYKLRSESAMKNELRRVECLLLENRGQRHRSSLQDLANLGEFYTIDDPFIERAEAFLGYLASDTSLAQMLTTFGEQHDVLPDGPLLVSRPTGVLSGMFFDDWQVSGVFVREQDLRITARWTPKTDRVIWVSERTIDLGSAPGRDLIDTIDSMGFRFDAAPNFLVPLENIPVEGLSDYDGVCVGNQVLLSPSHGVIAELGGPSQIREFTNQGLAFFFYLLWIINVRGTAARSNYDYAERSFDTAEVIETRLAPALQRLSWLEPNDKSHILRCLPRRSLRIFRADMGSRRPQSIY